MEIVSRGLSVLNVSWIKKVKKHLKEGHIIL